MMERLTSVFFIGKSRSKETLCITYISGDGLVEGDPQVNILSEIVQKNIYVFQIPVDDLSVAEAAFYLQSVGQIPMIDGRIRTDPVFF